MLRLQPILCKSISKSKSKLMNRFFSTITTRVVSPTTTYTIPIIKQASDDYYKKLPRLSAKECNPLLYHYAIPALTNSILKPTASILINGVIPKQATSLVTTTRNSENHVYGFLSNKLHSLMSL